MANPKKAVKNSGMKSDTKVAKKTGSLQRVKAGNTVPKAAKKAKLAIPEAPYKKSELIRVLAEQNDVPKKDAAKVLESIAQLAALHLLKKGPGIFVLPGFLKMTLKTKPATKEKKGTNPFTGEAMIIKAKPTRRVVKVRVLKKFKSAIES